MKKKGSHPGRDNRTPFMGGTKFPTMDSTAHARGLLRKSQNVGASIPPQKTTVKDVTPSYGADVMPKVGADMNIENDPLIMYLKKVAMKLGNNEEVMLTGKKEQEVTTEDPTPENTNIPQNSMSEWRKDLNNLFAQSCTIKFKYYQKDHPYKSGTVARIAKQ